MLVANNLSNKPLGDYGVPSPTIASNVKNAQSSWFIDYSNGDLHIISNVAAVIDKGQSINGLVNDYDQDSRPQAGGIDIGADEFVSNSAPKPPANLRIIAK